MNYSRSHGIFSGDELLAEIDFLMSQCYLSMGSTSFLHYSTMHWIPYLLISLKHHVEISIHKLPPFASSPMYWKPYKSLLCIYISRRRNRSDMPRSMYFANTHSIKISSQYTPIYLDNYSRLLRLPSVNAGLSEFQIFFRRV